MIYYRLLKDTPATPAGTVFHRENYLSQYSNYGTTERFESSDVEAKPEWFEEVKQIFVREFNADKLKEIDKIADKEDILAPIVFTVDNSTQEGCNGRCDGCEGCE